MADTAPNTTTGIVRMDTSPLAQAWRQAYNMVAGANPYVDPDLEFVTRLARRIVDADTRRRNSE